MASQPKKRDFRSTRLHSVSAGDPLDRETLAACLQRKSPEDRSRVVQAYIPMVYKIVKKAAFSSWMQSHINDLFQEGVLGLFRTFDLYEPGRGCSFTTFAYRSVYMSIWRYSRDRMGCLRIPPSLQRAWRNDGLSQDEQGSVFSAAYPDTMQSSFVDRSTADTIGTKARRLRRSRSMEEKIDMGVDMATVMNAVTTELSPRHAEILTMYLNDVTMRDMAPLLGISRSRVGQLKDEAMVVASRVLGVETCKSRKFMDTPASALTDKSGVDCPCSTKTTPS